MAELLARYKLAGRLTAQGEGRIPLKDPSAAEGRVEAELLDGHVSFRGLSAPVQRFHVSATWPVGPLEVLAAGVQVRDGATTLLDVQEAHASIPTLPQDGGPLVVDRLELIGPRVVLKSQPQGGFVGWDRITGRGARQPAEQAPDPPEVPPGAAGPDVRLHTLELDRGEVIYDAGGDLEPMNVSSVALSAEWLPSRRQAGWYEVTGRVRRDGLLNIALAGHFNAEQALLDLERFQLSAALGEAQYELFPPQAQKFLREHELRGGLEASWTGRLPLRALAAARGQLRLRLTDARLALSDTAWPVSQLLVDGEVSDATLRLAYSAKLLSGSAEGSARVALAAPHEWGVTCQVDGVQLGETLRVVQKGEPRYAGELHAEGRITGKFGTQPMGVQGTATVGVAQGRLVQLPVIRDILALGRAHLGMNLPATDEAHAELTFEPDHVQVRDGTVRTAVVALRGTGRIYYDRKLDLQVNASPLGSVQERLGPLGDIIGALADEVVTYKITGTMSQPSIGLSTPSFGGW